MEKRPSFVLMLSLEQTALRRIAVALYSEPRVLASISSLKLGQGGRYRNIWRDADYGDASNARDWRKTVEDRLSKLRLPESLTNKMVPILKAVGSEIYLWEANHEEYLGTSASTQHACLQKLCWTSAGTVDYRKTAENLARCDLLRVVERFELACMYGLEEYIPLLWEQVPDKHKRTFYQWRAEMPHLQLFLPYILEKHSEIETNDGIVRTVDDNMTASEFFRTFALEGNRTLTGHCFKNLTKEERDAILVETAIEVAGRRESSFGNDIRRKNLSDVVCYLLSLMTREEHTRIFNDLPEILECFLDWPWQDLFSDLVDAIWSSVPECKYFTLEIVYVGVRLSGYYFPNLFQSLFLRCPIELKKLFVDRECSNKYFFDIFFENGDAETMAIIFGNIDASDRMRLVSSEGGLICIAEWAHEWHLMEVFLRSAELSEEDKERLKESFIELLGGRSQEYRDSIDLLRKDYRRFFEFVEGSGTSAGNKRSLENESVTKSKRICCETEDKCCVE